MNSKLFLALFVSFVFLVSGCIEVADDHPATVQIESEESESEDYQDNLNEAITELGELESTGYEENK